MASTTGTMDSTMIGCLAGGKDSQARHQCGTLRAAQRALGALLSSIVHETNWYGYCMKFIGTGEKESPLGLTKAKRWLVATLLFVV